MLRIRAFRQLWDDRQRKCACGRPADAKLVAKNACNATSTIQSTRNRIVPLIVYEVKDK